LSAVNSNACKFTPSGGKLTVKTRLIIPALPTGMDDTDNEVLSETQIDVEGDVQRPLSANYLSQHDKQQDKPSSLEWIAVRIEVTDTGYGIKAQDMAQSKLFCKYIGIFATGGTWY
jgi:osomolarity two-component system sensor histidine kinase SLN1